MRLLTVRLMFRADFGELSRAVHRFKLFVCRSRFDLPHRDPEQKLIGSPLTLRKPRPVGGEMQKMLFFAACTPVFGVPVRGRFV